MKNALTVFAVALALAVPLAALGGERVVCVVWLDDGGTVARSTAPAPRDVIGGARPITAGLASSTLDGYACPANRLQPDGGIQAWDGGVGFELTAANGQPTDGGVAGCVYCDFRGVTTLVMQCRDPVYYSEKWDGGVDAWGQRGVIPATSNDVLVDFDVNPDGYRIDMRATGIQNANQHISVKPVSAGVTNFCTFSTAKRIAP